MPTLIQPVRNRISRKTLTALALALIVGMSVTGTAHADWHGRGDDWRAHERQASYWRYHHPHYVPGYVYTPPAVVYAPPPPPSGLSIFFPLHIN